MSTRKKASSHRVCYFHDPELGSYCYGAGHPMKPNRLVLTHQLVLNYDLVKKVTMYRPHHATAAELMTFHTPEYVNFLQRITPSNYTWNEFSQQLRRFNVGDDCPVFDGLYDYCTLYTGGSLAGAAKLCTGDYDIAVNWAGGLHHARKEEASGFCYINDISLAILELLKFYPRVLYVDIDVHHGDGVQDTFYATDRVLTLSLHKYGENFFPGTGDVDEWGAGRGTNYSINVPFKDGIDDWGYENMFKPVVRAIMEHYRPAVVVLQCGADSLKCDRLGQFNLSLKGHGECVAYIKSFNLPTLVLGGGGYTIKNVARCWAYETSLLVDTPVSNEIPYNDYFGYFGPDFTLHPAHDSAPPQFENLNTRAYLERIKIKCLETLRSLDCAPSVQMAELPPAAVLDDEVDDEFIDPDTREMRSADPRQDGCEALAAELMDSAADQERDGGKEKQKSPSAECEKKAGTTVAEGGEEKPKVEKQVGDQNESKDI